jgi:hypothetical protein
MRVFTNLQIDKDRKQIDKRLDEKDTSVDESLDKSPKDVSKNELDSEVDWIFRLSLPVL